MSYQEPISFKEITLRVILISIILTIVLSAANTYLALKIGMLTSASIPAAIMAMGILRFFKNSNIFETNLIQTAASAGEAVAGGIVYTIPALIIIHYWDHFPYFENFMVALLGGLLGVFFSVPIRRILVHQKSLPFPEGVAIAEVIKLSNTDKISIRPMVKGMSIGAVLEFFQAGPQIIATQLSKVLTIGKSYLLSLGVGFSATLLGAGYLVGFRVGASLLVGAILNYFLLLPYLSHSSFIQQGTLSDIDTLLTNIKYVGLGGMLMGGGLTLLSVLKSLLQSLRLGLQGLSLFEHQAEVPRSELDLSPKIVASGLAFLGIVSFFIFQILLPMHLFSFVGKSYLILISLMLVFVIIVGFIGAALCGYFSGLVGVTASPGSAIILGGVIVAALLLQIFLRLVGVDLQDTNVQHLAAAVVIIACSFVTGIACIANDNLQDLKVGHIIRATPRNQQILLMLGVVIAALLVPLLMQTLYKVYGIAGAMPHPGMLAKDSLTAPQAAMLATISQTIFAHSLPYHMMVLGAAVSLVVALINYFMDKRYQLSILSVAMGMYFPISTTVPLFLGALFSLLFNRPVDSSGRYRGILLACGMVCGAALVDVMLAFPFAISGNPDLMKFSPLSQSALPIILAILSIFYIGREFSKKR